MDALIASGAGFVLRERLARADDPEFSLVDPDQQVIIEERIASDAIGVTPFGVVIFVLDGKTHIDYNLRVEFTEIEYSAVEVSKAQIAAAQAIPNCTRCNDDPTSMPLGRCPACGKKVG